MKLSNMTANKHDEPTITITLTGAHEIYRFAHHMEYGQCEFADAGRKIIDRLKRRCDRAAWSRWVKPLREAETGVFGVHKNDRAPIAWDGSDESLNRILTALNGRAGWGGTNPLGDLRLVNPGTVGLIPLQGRIQIVGDSFVILPPGVTP